ncbi:GNAT family N-acetyltransferase [Planomicrobium okeanokoites]|uniref:GNAT family N-acetyltransferase n=1 Tax=Planomicrobium okeanokoites TaxID=244 RepID=A0ABV7KSF0_PLAOK|nr:GNAT family protein [Planomicrobium okeanokoites]TAA70147.1 N-acetyltransferase [Planomicrobium okeanokoites]
MEKLETDRLYLREFKKEDWSAVHKYASLEHVSRNQPWGPNTIEETKAFVEEALKDTKNAPRTRYLFAIVLKEHNELIGAVEITIRSVANKSGEIGYIVNPDHWGKGIATEAASMMIGFGFKELELHRIYATCAPGNEGSRKVLEKLGMRFEGRMRDHILLKDGWRDSDLFSILAGEKAL